jgi:hypothetical protein
MLSSTAGGPLLQVVPPKVMLQRAASRPAENACRGCNGLEQLLQARIYRELTTTSGGTTGPGCICCQQRATTLLALAGFDAKGEWRGYQPWPDLLPTTSDGAGHGLIYCEGRAWCGRPWPDLVATTNDTSAGSGKICCQW